MDLNHINVAFVCNYAADYGGNFLCMLVALAKTITGRWNGNVLFIFPCQGDKAWLQQLQNQYSVAFVGSPYIKTTVKELTNLFNLYHIDIVHTHFEEYDVTVARAASRAIIHPKMVWHLHDNMTNERPGTHLPYLHKLMANYRRWKQYGWYGRNAFFVPVSTEVGAWENHYRRHFLTFAPENLSREQLSHVKLIRGKVVINGIDIMRLKDSKKPQLDQRPFKFITFGGQSYRKGIPTILDAADRLNRQRHDFTVTITLGADTAEMVHQHYGTSLPSWLILIKQTESVAGLLSSNSCFISASMQETMSMAVAEASIIGLPVIQSDIIGTWWNAENPSTYLFPVSNADKLAEKMAQVMDEDPKVLAEHCAITAKINKERLSMQKWVDNIIDIYHGL